MEKGIILFDIDGTLLRVPGAGRAAFAQAFNEAFGWEQGVEHVNFYGATDLNVFRGICVERGVESTPEMERAFFDRLAPALETRLAECSPVVFPNVEKILQEVSGDWKLGIVTGNIEATAWAKLRYAGLSRFFSFGGFGCTHADRADIARHALKNSGVKHPEKVVLVGDTPSDIHAAKANGFISIAVATGGFDVPALEKAGADFVFADLTNTKKILSVLNGQVF
ncbi:MAG: HAD family hydrolase [Pontiellaceae bacterium]|jgi:phosphoglycolate phosphatase-like HAD superfamily hydrolase|nr:HAD family hydrolase [Pontiellaceae bacterium]